MRKNIFLIGFQIILLIQPLFAGDLGIGIKGGLSIHKLKLHFEENRHSFTIDYDYRMWPALSLFVEYLNTRYLSQQLTLGYFQAGGSDVIPDASVILDEIGEETKMGKHIYKFNYVSVSYALKIRYLLGKIISFAMLGLQYERLINHHELYISGKNDIFYLHNFHFSELNKNNVAPIFGFGLGYTINQIELQVEFLSLFHVIPFYEHEKTIDYLETRHTIMGFILNTGFKFYL